MYNKLIYGNYYTIDFLNEYFLINYDEKDNYVLSYIQYKTYSDVDVTRYNTSDTSIVMRVTSPTTDISGSDTTIDIEHYTIHEGYHFFDGRVLEIPANLTWSWVVETGTKAPHMTYEVSPTNGGVAIMSYEGITANADGTLITPLNNNRLSTEVSTVKFRLNPTGISTATATTIRSVRIGTIGGTSQRAGGNLVRTNEVVFKKNTKYLLTIQNLNNDVVYVNLTHNFYENGL